MTAVASRIDSYDSPSPEAARARAAASARLALVHGFCWPYRVHLLDHAAKLAGSDREGADLVARAFAAIQEGRFPVPMVDTYRRLRDIVTEVAR
jgi:hypothetical protein